MASDAPEVARRVIGMHFSVDDDANRQRRERPDGLHHRSGIDRRVAAVDNDHTLFGEDDARSRVHLTRRLDVDPFFDLTKLGTQFLRPCR